METVTLSQQEYIELVSKAARWEALYEKIDAFFLSTYADEEIDADLLTIGEIAATATGHL